MVAAHLIAVLLSSSEDIHLDLSKVSPVLAVAAGVAIVVWLLVLVAFAVLTRPREVEAEPPTMDLGPESPAVADLLVNHCHVTPRAVPATLLDLAARHYLQVEEYGDSETLIRLRQPATPDLTRYEQQTIEQVQALAENGVVPVQALTLGTRGRAERWHRQFAKEVVTEAKAKGLTQDRWDIKTWTAQRLAGFAAGALVVGVAAQAGGWQIGLAVVFMAASGAHALLQRIFGTQRLTEPGYKSAAHWLGVRDYMQEGKAFESLPAGSVVLWDRYFAYAAAFGLARTALATMPMGVEDDHRAWSGYGGSWHNVHVSYPRFRVVWGRTPMGGLFAGLVITAIGVGLAWLMVQLHGLIGGYHDDAARWVRLVSVLVAAGGVAIAIWGVHTMALALADFGTRKTVDGELVRCRSFARSDDKLSYYLAVDDGASPRIKAWLVDPAIYNSLQEGSTVRATISSRFCHVYQVEVVRRSRQPSVPDLPDVHAEHSPTRPVLPGLQAMLVPSVEPSELVTAEEAAAALGEPVMPAQSLAGGEEGGVALPFACVYAAASGRKAGVVVGSASGPIVRMMSRLYAGRQNDVVEVAGGPAYLHGDTIVLVRGDTGVMVRMQGGSGDTAAGLKQLAAIAAARVSASKEKTA